MAEPREGLWMLRITKNPLKNCQSAKMCIIVECWKIGQQLKVEIEFGCEAPWYEYTIN